MDFEKMCMVFTMQEPYYGILLSSMQREETKKLPTIGVTRSGSTFKLRYNPDFIKPLSLEQVLQLLKHEALHVAFNHFDIWERDASSNQEQKLRNIATDLEVNSYLNLRVLEDLHPCKPGEYGWKNCLGTREYYKKLLDLAKQEQQKQQEKQSEQFTDTSESNNEDDNMNSTVAGSIAGSDDSTVQEQQITPEDVPQDFLNQFNQIDDHKEWPEPQSREEAEELQETIDNMLVMAAEECEKSCGKLPSELQKRIAILREKKAVKPIANWKRYVRRYLGNEFSEEIRKSKKRESKRFEDATGNRHKRKSNILVAIDTSGSISMPEYKEFFNQIRTLTSAANFHVIECDDKIRHEYDYKNRTPDQVHGGGGTSFQPVIDRFLAERKHYETLVYFTDGCCTVPKNTPKETLWVISSKGNPQRRKEFQINGASVVYIPKPKQ